MYLNYITYKSYFVNKIDKKYSISNLISYGTFPHIIRRSYRLGFYVK